MAKNIIDTIFSMYNSFFDAEKKIADYIINNKEKVIELTVAELARESETSDATVSRFCKKCDLKGFHHLKIALAKELSERRTDGVSLKDININDLSKSLESILENKIEEITQTIKMIEDYKLNEVLEVFKNAESVQFAAVGNTIPVALDAAYKFNQIGIKALALSIWETQLGYGMNSGSNDVIVIISNSGESKNLISMAKAAKKNGVKIIGITNSESSPISKLSDYHFTTATRERVFLEEYYFSRISAMTIIEVFYLLLTRSHSKFTDAIRTHEELIAEDKI